MSNAGLEKNLLWAVLERAILDASGMYSYSISEASGTDIDRLRRQAKRWIFLETEDNHKKPFSFDWICIELDIEPCEMRAKIKRELVSKHGRGRTRERTTKIASILDAQRSATEAEVYYL